MADSKKTTTVAEPAAPDDVPKTAEAAAKHAAEAVATSEQPPAGLSTEPLVTEHDFTPVTPLAPAMRSAGEAGAGPVLISPGILNTNPDHALAVLRTNPPVDSRPGLDPTPPAEPPGTLEMITLRDGRRYAVRSTGPGANPVLEPITAPGAAGVGEGPGPGSRDAAATTGKNR